MENKIIARKFRLLSQLMELHSENPFKSKAIANASFKLDKLPFKITEKTEKELSDEQGIGKSTANKVWELIYTGSIAELDELLAKTPEGVLEMLTIKGLGPKKIVIIWRDLGIETLGELYYACNENRLVEAKGFGLKTQDEIRKAIEFNMANQGFFLYAQAEKIAHKLFEQIVAQLDPSILLAYTGEFRRRCEVISSLQFITTASFPVIASLIENNEQLIKFEQMEDRLQAVHESGLAVHFIRADEQDFPIQLLLSTGNDKHIEVLKEFLPAGFPEVAVSEEYIYQAAGLDYIAPELREGTNELVKARTHRLPQLIQQADLKGSLHNHSTWSDGVHSLEEMAIYCKEILQLSYLGICDHSKTAVYANGLKEDRIRQQWQEIDHLNSKLAPFKIFKGVESDILGDGTLDYHDDILQGFDFVVASIHSNLKMDEEKATARLIKAIENPYTTILGHPTGRLLLSRKGYPIDFKKVIDACAANQVVIEINANPLRLDLDWRWHQYALEKDVLLSINPDAHRAEGLHDMYYGTLIARKGGLDASRCLNAFSLEQLENYFQNRKLAVK